MNFNFVKLLNNKKIHFLFILFLCILFSSFFVSYFKLSEGFSLSSVSQPTIPKEYEYLKPITDTWSINTQLKFVDKMNPKKESTGVQIEWLSTTGTGSPFGAWFYPDGMMKWITEEEALYYIDNGMFPYDDYVTNYLTKIKDPPMSQTDLDNNKKILSNRSVYANVVLQNTYPGGKLISEMGSGQGGETPTDTWTCRFGQLLLRAKNDPAAQQKESTDYSFFTKNIPGFEFQGGEPCNPCEFATLPVPKDVSPFNFVGRYNSPDNKCKFTVPGVVPEAYNIYMGNYGALSSASSKTDSDPSSIDTNDTIASNDKINLTL